MSMSPERDIPIEVAKPQEYAMKEVPKAAANGTATSTVLPQMPLMFGGKSVQH